MWLVLGTSVTFTKPKFQPDNFSFRGVSFAPEFSPEAFFLDFPEEFRYPDLVPQPSDTGDIRSATMSSKVRGSSSLVYGITTLLQKKLDRSTQFDAVGYIITLYSSKSYVKTWASVPIFFFWGGGPDTPDPQRLRPWATSLSMNTSQSTNKPLNSDQPLNSTLIVAFTSTVTVRHYCTTLYVIANAVVNRAWVIRNLLPRSIVQSTQASLRWFTLDVVISRILYAIVSDRLVGTQCLAFRPCDIHVANVKTNRAKAKNKITACCNNPVRSCKIVAAFNYYILHEIRAAMK